MSKQPSRICRTIKSYRRASASSFGDVLKACRPLNLLAAGLCLAVAVGVEAAAAWQALDNWRLHGSYSFLKMDVNRAADLGTDEVLAVAANPMRQASLHSLWNLAPQWDLDLVANYLDAPTAWTSVESYVRLDTRLAWRSRKNMELSIGVQSLVDNRHPEAEVLGLAGSVSAVHIPGRSTESSAISPDRS